MNNREKHIGSRRIDVPHTNLDTCSSDTVFPKAFDSNGLVYALMLSNIFVLQVNL